MKAIEHTQPFRHWLVDHVLPETLATRIAGCIPSAEWTGWVRYSSVFESGKRTCRDFAQLPVPAMVGLGHLSSVDFSQWLREITGIEGLIPSPFTHGGGLHITDPGGKLEPHIDFAKHPKASYLERRLSLILYLSEDCGGSLQLWNEDASEVMAEYPPKFNSAVLFENSDWSFHSVSEVVNKPRVSLASYYCAPIRAGVNRLRALFAPRR